MQAIPYTRICSPVSSSQGSAGSKHFWKGRRHHWDYNARSFVGTSGWMREREREGLVLRLRQRHCTPMGSRRERERKREKICCLPKSQGANKTNMSTSAHQKQFFSVIEDIACWNEVLVIIWLRGFVLDVELGERVSHGPRALWHRAPSAEQTQRQPACK